MRLSDIIVGEDYAIRWGGGPPIRGRVTYAGRDREYFVPGSRGGGHTATGARVFFVRPGLGSDTDLDVPPGNVVCPWAEEQARVDTDLHREAVKLDRVQRVAAALAEQAGLDAVRVSWDWLAGTGRYSETRVVVPIAALEAALGMDR